MSGPTRAKGVEIPLNEPVVLVAPVTPWSFKAPHRATNPHNPEHCNWMFKVTNTEIELLFGDVSLAEASLSPSFYHSQYKRKRERGKRQPSNYDAFRDEVQPVHGTVEQHNMHLELLRIFTEACFKCAELLHKYGASWNG